MLVFEYVFNQTARLTQQMCSEHLHVIVEVDGVVFVDLILFEGRAYLNPQEDGVRVRMYADRVVRGDIPKHISLNVENILKQETKERISREEYRAKKKSEEEVRIRKELLAWVQREPGKSRTFYERTSEADGGVKGSQEKKLVIMQQLLDSGKLEMAPVTKPMGRLKQVVVLKGYSERRAGELENLKSRMLEAISAQPGKSPVFYLDKFSDHFSRDELIKVRQSLIGEGLVATRQTGRSISDRGLFLTSRAVENSEAPG